jgi:TolB-like protein
MSLFSELRRRNVFRVAIAYLITAWLLIQLADILIPMLTLPEWVARLVFLLLVILFIPTLIAAWALELTPDGLKLEKDVDRSSSITPSTGKKLNGITIGLLVLAVTLLLVDKFYLSADDAPVATTEEVMVDKSIAVLPFADLSQEQDQEWFADGLAEEILNALARTPDLLVASRTSAFAYKGSDKDLRLIATELGVAHILEGSVRRAGDRLRITAQLIRASDGFHLWSQNYDRDVADVIDMQEDLATNIANAMETTMDPDALADMLEVGTQSVEAYQAYLRGIAYLDSSGETGERENDLLGYARFEEARNIDPGFSEAHFYAANFWRNQATPSIQTSNLTDATFAEIYENYEERIDLAVATARTAVDQQKLEAGKASFELRLRRAISLYRGYLEERPNDIEAWGFLKSTALYLGDIETQLLAFQRLAELGQTQLFAAQMYMTNAYITVGPATAAEFGLEALQRWPDDYSLLYQTHRTLMWAKRPDDATRLAEHFDELFEYDPMVTARQACMAGHGERVAEIIEQEKHGNQPNLVWLLYNLQGETELATEALRKFDSEEFPYTIASWLSYHTFDPTPYPVLMQVVEREGIQRRPVAEMPYICPPN